MQPVADTDAPIKSALNRRAFFFFAIAFLCLLLVPFTLEKYRFVGIWLVFIQCALGLLSLFDDLSRRRANDRAGVPSR
jgi:hypothetical protein